MDEETQWLTKERAIHRDRGGNILPVVEIVEYMEDKPKIKVLPMTRGEIQKLGAQGDTTKDQDKDIIKKYCLQPELASEDIDKMSLNHIQAIIWAIMSASTGQPQSNFRDKTINYVEHAEEWLEKKGA